MVVVLIAMALDNFFVSIVFGFRGRHCQCGSAPQHGPTITTLQASHCPSEKDIVRGRGGSPSRRGRAIPTLRTPPLLDKRRLLPAVKDGFLPLAEINSPTGGFGPRAQRTANDFLHGLVAALGQCSETRVCDDNLFGLRRPT